MDGQVDWIMQQIVSCRHKLVGEVGGYLIADFRMAPNAIVKHLDVFKDHLPGLLPGSEAIMMQAFSFECTKVGIFSHSICINFFHASHRLSCNTTSPGVRAFCAGFAQCRVALRWGKHCSARRFSLKLVRDARPIQPN